MKRGFRRRLTIARTTGLKRSVWPTRSGLPARRAASAIASASGSVAAIGFSTSTARPRARQSRTTGACSEVGTATLTACTSLGRSRASVKAGTP